MWCRTIKKTPMLFALQTKILISIALLSMAGKKEVSICSWNWFLVTECNNPIMNWKVKR